MSYELEGDTLELAERHAIEHAESINVPKLKMGVDIITNGAKVASRIQMPNVVGIGGAPTRVTTLPKTPAERKTFPIASGLLDYFPDALAAIAHLSWVGNEQHNPGQPLHWDRSKSTDEADTMLRHFMERGTKDTDGERHSTKAAWRALALLQKEIEAEQVSEVRPVETKYPGTRHTGFKPDSPYYDY